MTISELKRIGDKKLAAKAVKLYAKIGSIRKVAVELEKKEGIKRSYRWVANVVNKHLADGKEL